MRLKYVGPKPQISHSSIVFNTYKKDKFIYINIVYELIKALSCEYQDSTTQIYHINTPPLSAADIEGMVTSIIPLADSLINIHVESLSESFEEEIRRVKENTYMDDISKEVWLKNYEIMKDYRLQRGVNKSVYYMLVKQLISTIKEKHIQYIITPMSEKFIYVLNNIQNILSGPKTSLSAKLDIYEEKGELRIRLQFYNP